MIEPLLIFAKTVWIPVHPELGPDWSVSNDQEDRPTIPLTDGFHWRRFIIKIDEED